MTNHSYFNLAGDPANHSVTEDILYVNSSAYTPVDDTYMTTGEIATVLDTPFDFRNPHAVGKDIDADNEQIRNGNGYDHNWVLDTKGDITKVAVELWCPTTGIDLKVYTDEPGIQIYSGNFLDWTAPSSARRASPTCSAAASASRPRSIPTRPTSPSGRRRSSVPERPTTATASSLSA